MRYHLLLPILFLAACDASLAVANPPAEAPRPAPAKKGWDINDGLSSVVRINATRQGWSLGQPWEKESPESRRSLGAIVAPGQVLTTGEMVADSTYLEFESPDGKHIAPAKVIAVDYEANLALLGLQNADDKFFEGTKPLTLADAPSPGDTLDIYQVEENGDPLMTSGPIQTVDVISSFLPGQFFLTYEVKASLQSAASSFTLPVLRDGKFAGLLTSYDAKDQISDVIATDIVTRFIKEASDGTYTGFPSLGIGIARTEDSNFRAWLKLPEDGGGIYISSLRKGSPAEKAGLKKGDVIVAIDGHEIDRLGYYVDEHYGRLFWGHLVRGAKSSGETVKLRIMRDGASQEIVANLERRDASQELLPAYTFGKAPNYLVKGGLIFQELTRPMLQSFGEDRAPLKLLDVSENPEKYEARGRRVVFLSAVLPTPATVGYEPLRNLVVSKVDGKEIKDMSSLVEAFKAPTESGLHSIEFDDETFSVYLDEKISTTVDEQLLQRGLTRLSHTEEHP
jgi:S1-C subfamily serine protease